MNKSLKKIFAAAVSTAIILPFSKLNTAAMDLGTKFLSSSNSKGENFNFIKSSKYAHDFIYDGSLLLYGGILLICISVIGLILTLSKKKKHKKKAQKRPPEK